MTPARSAPPRPPARSVGARRREAVRLAQLQRDRRRQRARRLSRLLPAVVLAGALGLSGSWADAVPVRHILPADHPLASYRISYRTDLNGIVNDDTNVVRRPYLGAFLSRQRGELFQGDISTLDGLWIYTRGTQPGWYRAGGGRHEAFEDYRPIPALREAVRKGLARVLGTDTVLGRPCTVVRTGAPLGEAFKRPTGSEHADLWIDSTGVVLRQDWYLNAKRVEHMVATAFDPAATVTDADFAHAPTVTPPDQVSRLAGTTIPLKDDVRAGLVGHIDPPPGYRYDGGDIDFRIELGAQGANVAVEHYVNDAGDLLDVEHTDAGSAPAKGEPVSIGPGRVGYLTLELGTSFLSIDSGNGSVLTLRDVDPQVLLQAARTYR